MTSEIPPQTALENLARVADAALLNGSDRHIIVASINSLARMVKLASVETTTKTPTEQSLHSQS